MAEFKVNKELSTDIAELQLAAQELKVLLGQAGTFLVLDDLQTLPTAKKFIEQHTAIKDLLKLYVDIVVNDANDLSAMMASVQSIDNTIAGSHNVR